MADLLRIGWPIYPGLPGRFTPEYAPFTALVRQFPNQFLQGFHIDETLASRHHVLMVKTAEIKDFVNAVAREFKPERVVLFGSYAQGKATEDSDVDLLVIMRHAGDAAEQALEIRRRIDRSFPLDLIVKSPAEARRRLRQKDVFVSSILRTGRTLYERRRQRMG